MSSITEGDKVITKGGKVNKVIGVRSDGEVIHGVECSLAGVYNNCLDELLEVDESVLVIGDRIDDLQYVVDYAREHGFEFGVSARQGRDLDEFIFDVDNHAIGLETDGTIYVYSTESVTHNVHSDEFNPIDQYTHFTNTKQWQTWVEQNGQNDGCEFNCDNGRVYDLEGFGYVTCPDCVESDSDKTTRPDMDKLNEFEQDYVKHLEAKLDRQIELIKDLRSENEDLKTHIQFLVDDVKMILDSYEDDLPNFTKE